MLLNVISHSKQHNLRALLNESNHAMHHHYEGKERQSSLNGWDTWNSKDKSWSNKALFSVMSAYKKITQGSHPLHLVFGYCSSEVVGASPQCYIGFLP